MDFGVLRSGPIGTGPSESDLILSQHPLLSRPSMTINPPPVNDRQSADNDNLTSMHNYALRTILIGDHDTVTIADRDIHHARHRYPVSLGSNFLMDIFSSIGFWLDVEYKDFEGRVLCVDGIKAVREGIETTTPENFLGIYSKAIAGVTTL